jgi:hypothetical protein
MELPEEDCDYLRDKALTWELLPDGSGGCLVIKDYAVSAEVYDRPQTDLMIKIPAGYPLAGLDMFYVDPPLKLRSGGYPPAAETFEDHAGRKWQRFSRHLNDPNSPWQGGVDGIRSFLALVSKELRAKT